MEDLRGKGGGRLKHRTIDGDVQLCLRNNEKDSNDDSSSKGKTREEKESGSSTLGKTKHCVLSKMASGSKDMCPRSTEKNDDHSKKQRSYIHYSSKNMRSMHSSEKVEELVSELEGYRWDAIFIE